MCVFSKVRFATMDKDIVFDVTSAFLLLLGLLLKFQRSRAALPPLSQCDFRLFNLLLSKTTFEPRVYRHGALAFPPISDGIGMENGRRRESFFFPLNFPFTKTSRLVFQRVHLSGMILQIDCCGGWLWDNRNKRQGFLKRKRRKKKKTRES